MSRLPQVVGLMLCEKLEVAPATGQTSLVGIFNARRFSSFPTAVQSFTVFVALYGGEGEGTMELLIQRMETEQDINYHRRWVTFYPRRLKNLEIRIGNCIFPAQGRYSIRLQFDSRDVSHRYLDVYLESS